MDRTLRPRGVIVVICGLVLTEILGLSVGELQLGRLAPVLPLQTLLVLFAAGYHYLPEHGETLSLCFGIYQWADR